MVLHWLKRVLPASLYGRALLILVLPMLIMQALAIYFFYEQHWVNVERHLSISLTGDVALIIHEMQHTNKEYAREMEALAYELLQIEVRKEPIDKNLKNFPSNSDEDVFKAFVNELRDKIEQPFEIHKDQDNSVVLRVKMKDSVLRLKFSLKRLSNVTTQIFIWWMLGSALLLLFIATIFLRNQIRPIRKLAEVAESFGRGQDNIDFRPQGASEVRQAGRSFIAMRERLRKMINSRTEMLAAISHDLRTPLTRMRLALAMLPDQKYVKPLLEDVSDMEKMIQEYLDFARGEGREPSALIQLGHFLDDVIGKYQSSGNNVLLKESSECEVTLFPNAFRRCISNIIDNALRYGSHCEVMAIASERYVDIIIDDNGTGIAPDDRELAMRPFKRLDVSRNSETGGAGLGLSIVQDIVLRHGGEVLLEDSALGGLRVRIRLPL